jgi:sigma-B regulation protein RsbU (phosphoserine phosphatase)
VAAQIQREMLPQLFPLYPERHEFEVFASMDPAKEVGGDFYDIFMIDNDHLALVMADVSGKGIPAALFMVICKTLIKNCAMMGGSPAEIMEDVNTRLCEGNISAMFVTVWFGKVTLSTGEIVEANAGHENPVLLLQKDSEEESSYEELRRNHDLVLGALKKAHYNEDSFVMRPGDRLFIYTDGVPEASDKDFNMFMYERMLESLNRDKEGTPEEILEGVRRSVKEFVGDSPQFDDLTMLCVEYRGAEIKN